MTGKGATVPASGRRAQKKAARRGDGRQGKFREIETDLAMVAMVNGRARAAFRQIFQPGSAPPRLRKFLRGEYGNHD